MKQVRNNGCWACEQNHWYNLYYSWPPAHTTRSDPRTTRMAVHTRHRVIYELYSTYDIFLRVCGSLNSSMDFLYHPRSSALPNWSPDRVIPSLFFFIFYFVFAFILIKHDFVAV